MADGIRAAYAAAWDGISNPPLDGYNPHFKSKFSTLAAVMDCIREACAEHGIAYRQTVAPDGDGYVLRSVVCDGSEELELSALRVPGHANPQQFGSALTYMRRYQALADWGIVGDPDDDGNAAAEAKRPQPPKPDQRKKWVARVLDLKAHLIEGGMPAEDIEDWYYEHFGEARLDDLGKDDLEAYGKWLKGCVEMREDGNVD